MKILIYCINYAPELAGIGKYTGEMAVWLAANGHEVRAVVAPPYYPNWSIDPMFSRRVRRWPEVRSGVRVWRALLWVPSNPSGIKRLLHLASFALCSFPLMLRQLVWRPDVVWVVEPPLFCAPTALLVARMTGAKAWLHIQDYEVDAAFALGLLKGRLARQITARMESWLMRCFDCVSSISENMLSRALDKGVNKDKSFLFRNWIDLAVIHPTTHRSGFRSELGIPADAVIALYSGNMGGKQGLEIMAEAARLLADEENLYFVFCGNGSGKVKLTRLCSGLANVFFIDLQPIERLNELLGTADIHLLPQRADAADLVMPSKLTGMLASGRCIVATANPDTELGKVVQHCGINVLPGCSVALAEAICLLKRDAQLRLTLGQAGRGYAESCLDMNVILKNFESKLMRLHKPA